MKKKKSLKGPLFTILIIVAVFMLIGWVLTGNKAENEEKTAVAARINSYVSVKTGRVEKADLTLNYTTNGNFEAIQQLDLSAENSGRVIKVLVEEGARVQRGQVLAVINTDQLSVDLESAEVAYQNAMKDKQRYESAFQTGGVTRQQLDQATLALSNAEARLSQSRIRISDARVKASIDAVVNKRYIEPGAVVAPGTRMFELVNVSRLKLKVTVNEALVARLNTGDEVEVRASVYPDKIFQGKISFIAAKADQALNFPVEIEIAQNDGQLLRAGMYGTAVFNFPQQSGGILVPRGAFVGSVNSNEVFVMNADSTANIRKVVAGSVIGEQVEILQGLEEGEVVITSGQINLSEGSKVMPVD